ncbi:MAG: hypothetical protein WC612_08245 [Bdellovibrionales bacterium]|jgi:hypothetical protein
MARKPAPQEGRVQFSKNSFRLLLTNSMVGVAACVTLYASALGFHSYSKQLTAPPTVSSYAGWVIQKGVDKALGITTPPPLAVQPQPSTPSNQVHQSKESPVKAADAIAAIRRQNLVEAEMKAITEAEESTFVAISVNKEAGKMPSQLAAYLEKTPAVGANVQKKAETMRKQLPSTVDQARESGLIDDFALVEEITGFSITKSMTLSAFESSMGTDPKAGKDVLQVKMPTFLDSLLCYGDSFVKLVRPFRKSVADDVEHILPYIKTKNGSFLFDDEGYRRDHKNQSLHVKGIKKPLLKDKVESLRNDRFVAGMFTAFRLQGIKQKTWAKYQDDPEAMEFLKMLGDGFPRLAHAFGPAGVDRAIRQRNHLAKKGFPNESIREFFKINGEEPTYRACFRFAGVAHETSAIIDELIGQEMVTKKVQRVALNASRIKSHQGAKPPALRL